MAGLWAWVSEICGRARAGRVVTRGADFELAAAVAVAVAVVALVAVSLVADAHTKIGATLLFADSYLASGSPVRDTTPATC